MRVSNPKLFSLLHNFYYSYTRRTNFLIKKLELFKIFKCLIYKKTVFSNWRIYRIFLERNIFLDQNGLNYVEIREEFDGWIGKECCCLESSNI